MDHRIQLTLIYSGTHDDCLSSRLAEWASNVIAQRAKFDLNVISPGSFTITNDIPAEIRRRECLRRFARSDAFLVLTQAENADRYPSRLEELIESAAEIVRARPVGFVSYGDAAGSTSVHQLQRRLLALHAVPLGNVVSLHNSWELVDAEGQMAQPEGIRIPMARLLVQLNWWAVALKVARNHVPFERVC